MEELIHVRFNDKERNDKKSDLVEKFANIHIIDELDETLSVEKENVAYANIIGDHNQIEPKNWKLYSNHLDDLIIDTCK